MTRPRRDNGDTPFSAWMRSQSALQSGYGYDLENQDYWWHHYRKGYLMLLEEKCFNAEPSFAQRDTFSIVDQLLRFACNHPDCSVTRELRDRPSRIRYFGSFLVQFEHTSPDDGGICINHIPVSKEQFLRFLQFRWFPSTRSERIEMRREIQEKLDDLQETLDKYRDDVFDFERGMLEAERILTYRSHTAFEEDESA